MALFPRPSSWLARRHHALLFPTSPPSGTRTLFTPPRPSWHTRTGLASSRVQVYTSHVHDPYLNLAAEHFLLQHSHPDATVLFLYVNDPCVVLGRNQNPWVEANLGLVRRGLPGPDQKEKVHLVRRRSGGGAVFHDRGNVNYSVICPARVFDRDRHAAMVVRALGALRVPGALAVNARHDIVVSHDNAHATHATNPTPASVFKVSGSAYKLTRLRALHHGTCLLASPHLARIGPLLRGPAAPYTRARGVESVRSPVRNVGGVATSNAAFCAAVRAEFVAMYGPPDVDVDLKTTTGGIGVTGGEGDDVDDFGHEEITKGYRELTSLEWLYTQTPQFTFSTHPTQDDPRERPPLPANIPPYFRATITARHGQIQHADMAGFDGSLLQGRLIHAITDWREVLTTPPPPPQTGMTATTTTAAAAVGGWLNHLFGNNNAQDV